MNSKQGYYTIFKTICNTTYSIWHYVRRPTTEELKWFELFFGKRETDSIRMYAYQQRHSLTKKRRKRHIAKIRQEIKKSKKLINDLITDIEVNYTQTVNRYQFPIKQLSEVIYPRSFHNALYDI